MARGICERTLAKALAQTQSDRNEGLRRVIKPTGPRWRDVYCQDGVIARGNRIIKPGGVILFGGTRWQDDALAPLAGRLVGVRMGDVYCTDVEIYWDGYPGGQYLMTVDITAPSTSP